MLVSKLNLSITDICDKESSRYAMGGILVEKGRTVATDGRALVVVTSPEDDADFPSQKFENATNGEIKPVVVPAKIAKQVASRIPKLPKKPSLERAVLIQSPDDIKDGEAMRSAFGTTDAESEDIKVFSAVAGRFPPVDNILKHNDGLGDEYHEVVLDTPRLISLLNIAKQFKGSDGQSLVKIKVANPSRPILVEAKNDTQTVTGLLMPMDLDKFGK